MDTRRIRTRLERIERRTGVGREPHLVVIIDRWYGIGDTVPGVFDRPLEEWELYKQAPVQQWDGCTGRVVALDPSEEYRLRTGRDEAPLEDRVPADAYWHWTGKGRSTRHE
jgi:hypothetical protein